MSKNRENGEESTGMNIEIVNRHKSVSSNFTQIIPIHLHEKKSSDDQAVETQQIHRDLELSLIAEKRPRKSSIEVIAEEREDLIEHTENSENGDKIPKGVYSDINERVQDNNIDIGGLSAVYNYPNTEANHELIDKFSQMQEEKEESDYIEGLQSVLDDEETSFLDGIYFKELRKGCISLEYGINSV